VFLAQNSKLKIIFLKANILNKKILIYIFKQITVIFFTIKITVIKFNYSAKIFLLYQNSIQESDNDAIFNINDYCLKDKIVLLSRFGSRQPFERTAVLLDASNFSTSNRLLGGASASGKDSADILQ
jgi:hypothetical protein